MKLFRAALPLLMTAALAACGAGQRTAGQEPPGASLTWGIETQPVTFNPHQWAQNKARLLVFNQFDPLITRDESGRFAPWLAKAWRADGLTYTFELRDDVTFHDGTRFDAAAVKANLDQFAEPGYNPAVKAIQLRAFYRAEVLSSHTVKIILKAPDALFLDFLASPYGGQVSPASLKKAKDLKAGGPDVVGTGPFVLERFTPGQEIRYRRNPAYFKGAASLSQLTYRILPEAAVRVGALTSGQVQVIEGVPATELNLIRQSPELTVKSALNSGTAFSYYFNTSHAPFDDLRVRKAFREAVDLEAVLASVYQGSATRAWSIVGRTSPFYDATLEKTYGGDPAKANALLDEAGWKERDAEGFRVKDGRRLTVRTVSSAPFVRDRRDILAQAVQAQVKQNAGIDFQIRIVDQGSAQQAIDDDQYEIFENSRGDSDAGAALNLILPGKGAINRTRHTDPDVDTWLAKASATTDQAERARLYAQVQQRVVADKAIVFPIYVPADQIAASRSVTGLGFDPVSGTPKSAYGVRVGT